jgi:hypothetical protein
VDDPDAVASAAFSGNLPEIETHNALDLYDENWRLVYSIHGDELEDLSLGAPVFVSPDGHLYTSQFRPWPRLVRYRVSLASD